MGDKELPSEVRRLIAGPVASMDHVEMLRHLAAREGATVSLEDLESLMHIDRRAMTRVLRDLAGAGMLREVETGYQFAPSARDQGAVNSLIDMYNTRPVTLVRAIYARPTPVRSFADAFLLRRDD